MCFASYFLMFWWCSRGFKPFILILSNSFFLLFKTGIYRPSRTAKKFLTGKMKTVSVKMLGKSLEFLHI